MPIYTITSANRLHKATIDPFGCKITELVLNNTSIFWSGERPDGKQAATHPCMPNFCKVTSGVLNQLPQHGPARNEEWNSISNIPTSQQLRGAGKYQISNITEFEWTMTAMKGVYPRGLVARREFKISDTGVFTLTTTLENRGTEALPINPGEHCYFICPEAKRGEIRVNGEQVNSKVWNDHTEYRKLAKKNILHLPQIGDIVLEVDGYPKCALWSLTGTGFICCEPIGGEPEEIYDSSKFITSGEEKRFTISIC